MKKILVPFDFSKPAINAYRFALDVAKRSKGIVHLLHVIELPAMPNTIFTPVRSMGKPLMKEMSTAAEDGFEKLVNRYDVQGVTVVSKVEFGTPSHVIQEFAKKKPIDLIIMGTHGASGVKEFFVGSNTEKTVRISSVPVIAVKEFYKGPLKNIVFPVAIDIETEQGLIEKVKNLQAFFKAHLHLVWINTPSNFMSDTYTLDRLRSIAKEHSLRNFTINIFNHWYEEQGIMAFASSIKADMIAMGTHGRKGLSHLVSGSRAEDVVNHGKFLIWTSVMKNID